MKSTEFLKEEISWDSDDEATWIQKIKQNCQPYLKEVHPAAVNELYRGMKLVHKPFIEKKTRLEGRAPKDMEQSDHDDINFYFRKKFGAPFRDAMFCSGSREDAEFYGTPFIVFPKGNFEFLWSPENDDLYQCWEKNYNIESNMRAVIIDKYTNKDFKRALMSKHEIMIRCKSYYAVSEILWNEIMDEFK